MNYYTYEELRQKSYNEIFKILEDENLHVNRSKVYDYALDKNEMINIILKYRSFKLEKNEDLDILKIQEYIDINVSFVDDTNFIKIPDSIHIYQDIQISEYDNYKVILEEDKFSKYVLLTNQNRYIFEILTLEFIEKKDNLFEYFLTLKKHNNRMVINKNEMYYLVFLPKDFHKTYIKCNAVSVCIKHLEYLKVSENKINQYMYIYEDKIFLNNIILKDSFLCHKIKNENYYLEYFDKSDKIKQYTKFRYSKNNISSLSEILSKDTVSLLDIKNKMLKVDSKKLLSDVVQKALDKLNNINKKISKNIVICPSINSDDKINSLFFVNYYYIKNYIEKNQKYQDIPYTYLVIFAENNNFHISENSYIVKDKRHRYNIDLKTNILSETFSYTYNNIMKTISNYLKKNILLHFETKSTYIDIYSLQKKDDIKFSNFECIIDENITFNEENILFEAKKIYDYFIKNNQNKNIFFNNILDKVDINIKEIEEMIKDLILKDISTYFDKVSLIEIIKKYKSIKLIGNMLNNKIFLSCIKEYIPGKLIEKIKPNLDIFNNIFEIYENDKLYGITDVKLTFINNNFNYLLEFKNYKNQYIEILNTNKNEKNYIDIYSKVAELKLKIKNSDNNNEEEQIISLDKNYLELDEKEILKLLENKNIIYTQEELLDDIKEDILRLLFVFSNNRYIDIYIIKRFNDQTYFSDFKIDINV